MLKELKDRQGHKVLKVLLDHKVRKEDEVHKEDKVL